MNCANHPEIPAVAYCQYCGKPLCEQCVHRVNNVVSCDPCLAARVNATSGTYAGAGAPNPGATWSGQVSPGNVQPPANWGVEPGIAIAVGWIPGVGAVYNGQIAKALVHVAVFALLIDMTHYNGLIGLLIPIWILYMWWDAYQTTKARRYGQPLPNPLGLNDVGRWFNVRPPVAPHGGVNPADPVNPGNPIPPNPPAAPYPPYSEPPTPGVGATAPFSGFAPEANTQAYAVPPRPPTPPMPPVPPNQYDMPDFWHAHGRGIPTGAIILIVIGVGFLLANFGVLSEHWIDRGWPILLIAIGVWIVIQRSQTPRPPMPPPGGVR